MAKARQHAEQAGFTLLGLQLQNNSRMIVEHCMYVYTGYIGNSPKYSGLDPAT